MKVDVPVPPQLHDAIDRAMTRVVQLFMQAIDDAVAPIGPNHPTNIAAAVQAIENALKRIETALAQ